MAILTELVPTAVLNSLPAFQFQIDNQNQTCTHFTTRLRNFVVKLCQYYEAEVDQQLAKPDCLRSRDDLISWANDEITHLLFGALGRYQERIVDAETLGSQKIKCELGLTYFLWLVELTESVKTERMAAQQVQPSSDKFRKKRKSHPWTPYAVNVVFDELRRLFGTR